MNYLSDMAHKDSLTGLYNRRILAYIHNYSAIVICDIDDYKRVNDIYGHDVGDDIIKRVSSIIRNNIREKDYICRYGGDEFLIAFVDCPYNIAQKRIESIRKKAEAEILLPDNKNITMSFGIAVNRNLFRNFYYQCRYSTL